MFRTIPRTGDGARKKGTNMNKDLVTRIQAHAMSKADGPGHPPATKTQVERTEEILGFLLLPPLLKMCYENIGNGGFGPGYGVIGIEGGAESDYGSLIGTYEQLKTDQEMEGNEWRKGLLPICDWGCNTFSCVDCSDPVFSMWKFENFDVRHQEISIEEFFDMWIRGVDLLSLESDGFVEKEITNPFTGGGFTVRGRAKT